VPEARGRPAGRPLARPARYLDGGGSGLPTAVFYRSPGGAKPLAGRPRRFRREGWWYPDGMDARTHRDDDQRPLLLFFSNRRSGPARRMASLVAWVGVTEKKRLRVLEVDADEHAELARALDVSTIPSLVLVRGKKILGRLDGRATGNDISRLIGPHVASRA
jgi:hypothetical protein